MLALALAFILAQSDGFTAEELHALSGAEHVSGSITEETLKQMVTQTLPKVAGVMGRPVPRKLNVRVISREEASRKLLEVLNREYPGDRLARLGTALQLVHLVEPRLDLAKAAHALYSANASGFYDPHDHTLNLLQDQPMAAQVMIIPHEIAHAIQDEMLDLEKMVRAQMHSEDAQLAFSAAIEGNAQAVASLALASEFSEDGDLIADMMVEGTSVSAAVAAQASGAAPWLALQLSFPYTGGAAFVKAAGGKADPAGTKLLSRPPASTAQVMDPDLYRKGERPLSGTIGLARLLPGSVPVYETTLGRANLELLGELHAERATLGAGWRGDRLEAVRLDGAPCAAWVIAFARPEQAEQLVQSYARLINARPEKGSYRVVAPDKTASTVSRHETTVVVLERVPLDQVDALETAARAALR